MPSPQWYFVSVPARAAYSHSDSLGRRYDLPVFSDSHDTYDFASRQVTSITGRSPLPQPLSSGLWPPQPPFDTHASHCANVTSCFDSANS